MEDNNDKDRLVVAAVQAPLRSPTETPLEAARGVAEMISERQSKASSTEKIDLFVLPELCPVGYSEDTFANYLPETDELLQLYQHVEDLFAEVAKKAHAFICFGTVGVEEGDVGDEDKSPPSQRLTIRLVALNDDGQRVAVYDKMNLCDYGSCAETRFFSAQSPHAQPTSFTCRSFCVGMMICADFRFARLAHCLARDESVDLIVHSACMERDGCFATYEPFLVTRAVENSVYLLSANNAGSYFGASQFVRPWVDGENPETQPLVAGTEPSVLVGVVERRVLNHVRSAYPYFRKLSESNVKASFSTK